MTNNFPHFKFAIRSDLPNAEQFLPQRAKAQDTGWDVKSAKDISIQSGEYALIPLGFRMLAPEGWWVELRPRSSTFAKKQLHSLYGTIDEGFEGELLFAVQYIPNRQSMGKDLKISQGEAIGQIVPVRRKEMTVEIISNEEYDRAVGERKYNRGIGGFGSTSK